MANETKTWKVTTKTEGSVALSVTETVKGNEIEYSSPLKTPGGLKLIVGCTGDKSHKKEYETWKGFVKVPGAEGMPVCEMFFEGSPDKSLEKVVNWVYHEAFASAEALAFYCIREIPDHLNKRNAQLLGVIAKSAKYSLEYAIDVLGRKPFKEGEAAIAKDPRCAATYAKVVLKLNEEEAKKWGARIK